MWRNGESKPDLQSTALNHYTKQNGVGQFRNLGPLSVPDQNTGTLAMAILIGILFIQAIIRQSTSNTNSVITGKQ